MSEVEEDSRVKKATIQSLAAEANYYIEMAKDRQLEAAYLLETTRKRKRHNKQALEIAKSEWREKTKGLEEIKTQVLDEMHAKARIKLENETEFEYQLRQNSIPDEQGLYNHVWHKGTRREFGQGMYHRYIRNEWNMYHVELLTPTGSIIKGSRHCPGEHGTKKHDWSLSCSDCMTDASYPTPFDFGKEHDPEAWEKYKTVEYTKAEKEHAKKRRNE
jgi:hypothetical protein